MRFQLGIVLCLLAGCVTQPTTATPLLATGQAARSNTAPPGLVLRIGIEHLPPDAAMPADDGVRVEAQPRPTVELASSRIASIEPRRTAGLHTWQLSASDLAAIDNPIARETLQFVNDLVDADHRRVRREVGTPFFELSYFDQDRGPLLSQELAFAADQEEWVHAHGPALLQRPMRLLLRRLPIARQIELDFEDWRSDHVPLSEPYRQAHGDRRRLGRLSLRLHASDLADPVEIAYMHSGVRVGTSQGIGKLSVDWDLTADLRFELRGRTEYDTGEQGVRADLSYWYSPFTSLHMAIGDDMDFLSTSSVYSLFESPMDGSPGLVLYAVHTF